MFDLDALGPARGFEGINPIHCCGVVIKCSQLATDWPSLIPGMNFHDLTTLMTSASAASSCPIGGWPILRKAKGGMFLMGNW